MARQSIRLPKRFPAGTTYVVERAGSVKGMMLVRRYVQLPGGQRIDLAARLVPNATSDKQAIPRGRRPARARESVLESSN